MTKTVVTRHAQYTRFLAGAALRACDGTEKIWLSEKASTRYVMNGCGVCLRRDPSQVDHAPGRNPT